MKKSLVSFIALFVATFAFAQLITTMNIYRTDGTALYIPLNTIDSITYSVGIDANSPRIISVDVTQEDVEGGTNLYLHIVAESPTKVNWITDGLYGPNGNIHGGGGGYNFVETSDGIYECTRTDFISEWMPNGEYYYSYISVENEARYVSEKWPGKVSTIIASHTHSASAPEIQNITLSQEEVEGGTNLKLKIIVSSNVPVDYLNSSLYGPNGNIYGGGGSTNFVEISDGIYEYNGTDFISEWMPNGEYYYSNISVENSADLKSDKWTGELKATITTHKENITAPIITSVNLSKETVAGGTNLKLKIVATSNAPIDYLNISLYGPNGNIYGGGGTTNFTETSEGVYEHTQIDFISSVELSGKYYYSNISVENKAGFESDKWQGTVETYLNQ